MVKPQVEPFQIASEFVGRRRVPRRSLRCRIGLLVRGVYYLANAYEIGENGMMIDSPVPLKDKQLVVVSIRVADVLRGVMLSRVVYALQSDRASGITQYGLQFEKVEFDVKRMIRNFVASDSRVVLPEDTTR